MGKTILLAFISMVGDLPHKEAKQALEPKEKMRSVLCCLCAAYVRFRHRKPDVPQRCAQPRGCAETYVGVGTCLTALGSTARQHSLNPSDAIMQCLQAWCEVE